MTNFHSCLSHKNETSINLHNYFLCKDLCRIKSISSVSSNGSWCESCLHPLLQHMNNENDNSHHDSLIVIDSSPDLHSPLFFFMRRMIIIITPCTIICNVLSVLLFIDDSKWGKHSVSSAVTVFVVWFIKLGVVAFRLFVPTFRKRERVQNSRY